MSRSFSIPIQGPQIPSKTNRQKNDFKQRTTCSDVARAKRLVVDELVLGTSTILAPSLAGIQFSFPTTQGSNGQVLTTDGQGTTYWATGGGGGGLDPTVDNVTVLETLTTSSINSSTTAIDFNQTDIFNINLVSTDAIDTSSITNSAGSGITFGSENLSTTGTITATTLDVVNVTNSLGAGVSFGAENITTSGTIAGATLNVATITNSNGSAVSFGSENITTSGDVISGRIDTPSITNTLGSDIQINSKNLTNVSRLTALVLDAPSLTNSAGATINVNQKTLTNLANLVTTAATVTGTLSVPTITTSGTTIDFSTKNVSGIGALTATSISTGNFSTSSLDVQTITNSVGTSVSFGGENISTSGSVSGTTIIAGTSVSTPTITTSGATIGFSNKNLNGILSVDTPTITNSAGANVAFSKPISTSSVVTASGNLSLNPAGTDVDFNGKNITNAVIAGMGDVVGPASSTLNAVPRYSSTTGKAIKDSPMIVTDAGAVSGVTTLVATTSVTTPTIATASGNLVINPAGTAVDFSGKQIINAVMAGNGNVAGPGSATDNALARYDGTTGTVIQNSIATLSDTGVLLGLTSLETSTITAVGDLVINPTGTNIDFSGKTIINAVLPGGGNVAGPVSATDNAIVRFDGTTGDLIQNSSVIISDAGNITGVASIQTPSITTASGNLVINPTGTSVDFSGKQIINALIAGSGNVGGPVSSVDNSIALFDGTTGELIKGAPVTIDGSGNATGYGTVSASAISTPSITTAGSSISFNTKDLTSINSISVPTITTSGSTISFNSKDVNSIAALTATTATATTSVTTPLVTNGSGNVAITASGNVSLNPTGSIDFNSRPIINAIGVGDVSGPGVSTSGSVAVFDGITGKVIKTTPVTVDVTGNMVGVQDLAVDGTLSVSTINPPGGNDLSLAGNVIRDVAGIVVAAVTTQSIGSASGLTIGATSGVINFNSSDLTNIDAVSANQVYISGGFDTTPVIEYSTGDPDVSTFARYHNTVTTSDASATTLQTIGTASNTVRFVEANIVFRFTSGANTGKGGRMKVSQSFNNISGTVTANNLIKEFDIPAATTVNAEYTISGTNILLRVTGMASVNIQWSSDCYSGFC